MIEEERKRNRNGINEKGGEKGKEGM